MTRALTQFPEDDDLVDPRDAAEGVPMAIEAEQAVLGTLMFDNASLADVESIVSAHTFAEPFHQALYQAVYDLVGAGRLAEPTAIHERFKTDEIVGSAYASFGGFRYLVELVDNAPPATTAPDYARLIRETWQRREMIRLASEVMRRARVDRSIDATVIMDEAEKGLLGIQLTARTAVLMTAAEAVDRVIEEYENPATSAGVTLGLSSLDSEIGGLQPGEMWILAGRPSMGKSAIASTGALNVAMHGVHPDGRRLGWIEINGEMTGSQMMRRHIADHAFTLSPRHAPAYSKVRKRLPMTDNERAVFYRAAQDIRPLQTLRMVKRTGMTLSSLRSMIRRQVAAWDRQGIALGGVSIDHGGLIQVEDARRGRTEAQTQIAIGMKELADELGVPLLVLLQLNRQVESRDDKRPMLSDLRDSGAWEENADGVIGVYRDAYYAARETEPKGIEKRLLWEERKSSKKVEAILLKIREGEAGKVDLWADMPRNAIRGHEPDNLYGEASVAFDFASSDGAADARAPAAPSAEPEYQDSAWSDRNPAVAAVNVVHPSTPATPDQTGGVEESEVFTPESGPYDGSEFA